MSQSLAANKRAVLFDLDGTLYDQRRLRIRIACRLAGALLRRPYYAKQTIECLRAYRRAQEQLRGLKSVQDLGIAQFQSASRMCGYPIELVQEIVHTWMEEQPLSLLASCIYTGLPEFLDFLHQHHIALAVVSDYPAWDKLRAMGLDHYFQVVITAQDKDVQVFKPSTAGIRLALCRLGVDPHQALYIGDRPEVDGVAAARSGVTYANIGRLSVNRSNRVSYPELHRQWLVECRREQ
jgi:phosphoglycolate phosphatase/putative hydrolase of the HAD superfamily